MSEYFSSIVNGLKSFMEGLQITMHHFRNRKDLVATLQYPHEKWPVVERHIGFELSEYNVIRSRLNVDIDDCIGCLQCERACPVDCIKIETVKPPKGSDFDCGVTSNGTRKKMLVTRFSIDMTECMFCNLCTFPCPEDCIYMVGGPNSGKHEIEYEYSTRKRNDLIFEFATAAEDEIIAAGGQDYLNRKKGILPEKKAEVPVKKVVEKKVSAEPKINYEPVNAFEDRMTRALAKKTYTAGIRAGKNASQVAEDVKKALTEAGKYSPEYESIIENIAGSKLMTAPAAPSPEKTGTSAELNVKILNDIQDRTTRATAKKAFMAASRGGKDPAGIADDIRSALTEADKLTDEVKSVLEKIRSFAHGKTPEAQSEKSPAPSPAVDIKALNAIEDKMIRGLAKKSFMAAKRADKGPSGIVQAILDSLKEAGKLTPDLEAVVRSIAPADKGIGEEKTAAPAAALDIKALNDIQDRMTRGIAKKAFMAAKRGGGTNEEIIRQVQSALDEAEKLTDEVSDLLNKLKEQN